MADLPLYDEGEDAPAPRAREDMRFTDVVVKPYGDGRRVRLNFGLTPFAERPSVDITVTNAAGEEVSAMSLIEAMDTAFDFTIHLRGPQPRGEHVVHLTMYYPERDEAPAEGRQVVAEQAVSFLAQSPA